jgi:FG-GAP-like repeat
MHSRHIAARRLAGWTFHAAVWTLLLGLGSWLASGNGTAQTVTARFEALDPFELSVGDEDVGLHAFALAEVTGDQILDLVTIDTENDGVNVLRGVGDGTFEFISGFETENLGPTAVAVADVASPFGSEFGGNQDGNADIIVGSDSGDIEVFLGRGDGEFDPPEQDFTDFLDAGAIVGIALGDFDENGNTDIAVVDEEDTISFACNDEGNFGPCATDVLESNGDLAIDIVPGDFDGDGNIDVVVLNQDSEDVSPFYGDGRGAFTEGRTIAVGPFGDGVPTDFDAADMNADGITDLVVVTNEVFNDINAATLLGRRDRILTPVTFSAPFGASALTLADFDASVNRTIDAIVSPPDSFPFLQIGNGDGSITDGIPASGLGQVRGARAMAAGNIGSDALVDFIVLTTDGARMQVVLNLSAQVAPSVTPGTPPTEGATPTSTGPPPPTNTPTATVPTTTATATATPTQIPINYGRCHVQAQGRLAGIATGLLDDDGSPDIAVTDPTNNAVYIIFNTTQVQGQLRTCAMSPPVLVETPIDVAFTTVPVDPEPGAIAAIDIERDGDVDLLVAGQNGIQVLRNSGGVFTAEAPLTAGTQPAAIAVDYPIDPRDPSRRAPLDLNSDGRTDFVVANAGSPVLSIFYGRDGGLTITSRNIPGNASTVGVADFNQDGRVDIVAGRGSDALMLLQQRVDPAGESVFQLSSFGAGDAIVALASGFFDGDRSPDVLITRAQGLGQLYLFNGSTLSASGEFQTGSSPTASGVGLFNSTDGNTDAVVSSRTGGSVLAFGLGDGSGMFRGPAIAPFPVRGQPAALSVVNIDGDGMEDVVTANSDGTISILLSSVPPPTPTPPFTPTLTPTPTPSETGTPGDTPTETPTPSATPAMTDTPASTATRTGSPTPVDTPKEGAFELSGTGCSIDGTPARFPAEVMALSLLLAVMRWWRRRTGDANVANVGTRHAVSEGGGSASPAPPPDTACRVPTALVTRSRVLRGRLFLAGAGIAMLFGSSAPPADAQSLPTYVTCRVGSAALGATNSGLRGGAVGDFDNNRSPDLALVDSNQIVIALTNFELFKRGSCPEAITPNSVGAEGPSAVAVGLINNDVALDLAVAQRSAGNIALFNGSGLGGFDSAGTPAVTGPLTVAVANLNNDGFSDLVVGAGNAVALLLGRAQGDPIATTPLLLGLEEVLAVRVADFSGDAQLDVATVDALGIARVFVQTAPGAFGPPVTFSIGAFPTDMQVADPLTTGDFNRDFIPDLAFVGNDPAGPGRLRVFLGRRTAGVLSFEPLPSVAAGTGPSALGLADLNGDGRLDAAVTDAPTAEVRFFLGNGAGGLSLSGGARDTQVGANGLLLADVDDDSRPDVITTNGDGSLTIFLSSNPPPTLTPTATWTSLPTSSPTSTPESTATATPSETPSTTPTETPTLTPSRTRTPSHTRTFTETPITPGIFAVQGEGCAHVGAGGSASDAMPLVVLAALALLRRRGKR